MGADRTQVHALSLVSSRVPILNTTAKGLLKVPVSSLRHHLEGGLPCITHVRTDSDEEEDYRQHARLPAMQRTYAQTKPKKMSRRQQKQGHHLEDSLSRNAHMHKL